MFNPVLIVFSILFFGQLSSSRATIIRDCNSQSGQLTGLTVTGCSFNDDNDKCILIKGETANFVANFHNFNQTSQATLKIYGILMKRVRVPFSIEPDACTKWGVHCPLPDNTNSTVTISLPIKNEYPSLPVDIEVSLKDDKNRSIFCLQFSAELKSKSKNI